MPRAYELIVGVVLAILSTLFIVLVMYFATLMYEKNNIGIAQIIIELVFALIGYSLAGISIKLISGKKSKLFSNNALLFWALFFGTTGFITIGFGLYMVSIQIITGGVTGIVMGASGYMLASKRKHADKRL